MHTAEFDAIGTHWELTTQRALDPDVAARVHAVIDEYDRTFSRFRPDSAVSALAAGAREVEVPAYAADLFDLYRQLGDLTGGAVNPLVGRSLEALGYDASYSLRPGEGPVAAPAWADFVQCDGRVLRCEPGLLLDVGAAGKGQLVDLVAEVLVAAGATVIDAGGDMRVIGHWAQPLRVGLEDPADPGRVIGVVELADDVAAGRFAALAGSAPNRRRWANGLHHIVDATTGLPVGVCSVDARGAGSPTVAARSPHATWAMAETAMVADGAATALFFTDPAVVAAALDCATMSFDADRRAIWSKNFTVEVLS